MSARKKPNALFIEKDDILSSPILTPKAEDSEKYLMIIIGCAVWSFMNIIAEGTRNNKTFTM